MQTKRDVAVSHLQLAIHFAKKSTAAFNVACPDGTLTPNFSGLSADDLDTVGKALRDWGRFSAKSNKAHKKFRAAYQEYAAEDGVTGREYPEDIGKMLIELSRSMPDAITDAGVKAFCADHQIPIHEVKATA